MIAAWIPPSANAVKDFEGHDSVTIVYYLGTCLAAEGRGAAPAELRRPPDAAACAPRPPSVDCIMLPYPSATPDAVNTVPGTTNSGRNGCRVRSAAGHAACQARPQRAGCELVEPLLGYPGASNGLAAGGR